MVLLKRILILIVLTGSVLNIQSQISSDIPYTPKITAYKLNSTITQQDSIYVFSGIGIRGSITASFIHLPNHYSWSKYDTTLKTWNPIIPDLDSNVFHSTISNLTEGYYMVNYTTMKSVIRWDTTIYFWVLLDTFISVQVAQTSYSCSSITLNAEAKFENLHYYQINNIGSINKLTDTLIPLPNPYTINLCTWYRGQTMLTGAHNGKYFTELYFSVNNNTNTYICSDGPSPPDTTWYKAVLVDNYNLLSKPDSVKFNTPITTRAKFTYKVKTLTGHGQPGDPYIYAFSSDTSNTPGAPLVVQFINQSLNGIKFYWDFVDTVTNQPRKYNIYSYSDTTTYDTIKKPQFTYYGPGIYKTILVSFPKAHAGTTCPTDTFPVTVNVNNTSDSSGEFKVNNSSAIPTLSKLIPTVFTPGGDTNDKFFLDVSQLKDNSVKEIQIDVYSRSGVRVYHYEGPPSYESNPNSYKGNPGWDGTYADGTLKASSGIYYYTVIITGWDNEVYEDQRKGTKTFTGFVYLIRQ